MGNSALIAALVCLMAACYLSRLWACRPAASAPSKPVGSLPVSEREIFWSNLANEDAVAMQTQLYEIRNLPETQEVSR